MLLTIIFKEKSFYFSCGFQYDKNNYDKLTYCAPKIIDDSNFRNVYTNNNMHLFFVPCVNQNRSVHTNACGIYSLINILIMLSSLQKHNILHKITDVSEYKKLYSNMRDMILINKLNNAQNIFGYDGQDMTNLYIYDNQNNHEFS